MAFHYRVFVLFSLCLLTRLCFVGTFLDSYDSINFAFGLQEYNLALLQPHFPGYPVYVFISGIFFKIIGNDVWALSLPNVLFGSLTVYPLSLLTRRLFSEGVATVAAGLYIINPLCWLQAERAVSDTTGSFFILVSAYVLFHVYESKIRCTQFVDSQFSPGYVLFPLKKRRKRVSLLLKIQQPFSDIACLFWGSFVLGLSLGVRLSYFPFTALWFGVLVCNARVMFFAATGIICGICSWLVPQLVSVGWYSFCQTGNSFLYGHFIDWGGSIVTFGGMERFAVFAKSVIACGLGCGLGALSLFMVVPVTVTVFTLLSSLRKCCFHSKGLFWGIYMAPYLLWVIIGQNVKEPRHLLPFMPVFLVIISYGLCAVYKKWGKGISFALTLIIMSGMLWVSVTSVVQYKKNIPVQVQLVQFIEKNYEDISTRIYCGEEKRFFDYYAPHWDVRKARDVEEIEADLQSSLCVPDTILVVRMHGENKEFWEKHIHILSLKTTIKATNTQKELMLYQWNGR
ncbi:MAG: glycosyltransferase family 39 protein [Candidatus Brocadiaceae bacterium]|nr:glycosyltransferase family 39 protein [Candidatus Brocadiaceae bacterium]